MIGGDRKAIAAKIAERKRASYLAAQKLDRVGMGVWLGHADGTKTWHILEGLPGSQSDGLWVAKISGCKGSVSCERIAPAATRKGATA